MVLDRLTTRVRRSGPNPTLSETAWGLWEQRSITGQHVNDDTALALPAFYRGVSLIARTLAQMPIQVYQQTPNRDGTVGVAQKVQTPDTSYIWLQPNEEDTPQEFWQNIFADEVRGNAFIWVQKDRNSRPAGIWHIERQRVRVGRNSDGMKVYSVETDDGPQPMIDYKQGGEIVHLRNWGKGLVGYDPVKVGQEALAAGLSAQEFAARYFAQGAVPPGYLSTDQPLSPDESDKISAAWAKRTAGSRNSGRVPMLSNGAKFNQLVVEPEKAQMIETRSFSVADVARLLGLPPHLLADMDRSTSWGSGLEEQNQMLLVFNFAAHIAVAEQAVSLILLVRELTNRFAKFNIAALLRGTTLRQFQALALAYGRWMTPNEIRALLDLPPIEGGDQMPTAANLIPLDELGNNFDQAPQIGAPA